MHQRAPRARRDGKADSQVFTKDRDHEDHGQNQNRVQRKALDQAQTAKAPRDPDAAMSSTTPMVTNCSAWSLAPIRYPTRYCARIRK